MLQTESLVKEYTMGGTTIRALDKVTFQIEEGEMVAIMGPSGSGKSTLMNILGCLDQPDSGKYILSGDDISNLTPDQLASIRNKRVGFVFQTFNLLPRTTAVENVELPLLYAGKKKKEARQLAENALKLVGLGDRLTHEPNQLSGGQRQRMAIARALVTEPSIILADEPTGNLDSKTGEEIMHLFKEFNQKGRTIIIVTHEAEVADYCQKKVFLRDGKILSIEEKSAKGN